MMVYSPEFWKMLIEIVILWFALYLVLLFIKGTRTVQVLKGLVIIAMLFIITQWLGLETINWILTRIFAISVIAFLIIFQPELRRGLARLGEFGGFIKEVRMIDEAVKASTILAKKKIGALIALQREVGLKPYVESGISIDSNVTSELINTIFMPGTPLHDGGVIIDQARIIAAGCLFPLTQDTRLSKTMGTRHRAAIGLSEETDAVVIVVSEENGTISVAFEGKLLKDLDRESLNKTLNNIFHPKRERRNVFEFWEKLAQRVSKEG